MSYALGFEGTVTAHFCIRLPPLSGLFSGKMWRLDMVEISVLSNALQEETFWVQKRVVAQKAAVHLLYSMCNDCSVVQPFYRSLRMKSELGKAALSVCKVHISGRDPEVSVFGYESGSWYTAASLQGRWLPTRPEWMTEWLSTVRGQRALSCGPADAVCIGECGVRW